MPAKNLDNLTGISGDSQNSRPGKLKRRLASVGIPLGLLLGFTLVLVLLFGERLLPATPVQLETVVTVRETVDASPVAAPSSKREKTSFETPVLFQASGWFEPDPYPVKVTALVSGVVDEVFVLEGETVRRGDPIAKLIDEDARLNLQTAQADHALAKVYMDINSSAIRIAKSELRKLKAQLESARAILELRQDVAQRFDDLGPDNIPEIDIIERRQLALDQQARTATLEADVEGIQARIEQLHSESEQAQATLNQATTEVARRQLALDRTRVTAPVDGRVMKLLVIPGQQRMLGSENKDSGAVAYLYDPSTLQARVDVPLAEAAQLHVGQAVLLRTSFLPDVVLRGKVSRITGEADLQRNTLQAKVKVLEPDPRLRPDMLCRAEFLARGSSDKAETAKPRTAAAAHVRIFVPEAALINQANGKAEVWLLDASGERLQRAEVVLGSEIRDGYRRVTAGLNPGDRVVVDPQPGLQENERVTAAFNE